MAIPLEAEAWTWYGVVMATVVARFLARYLQLKSIKKFQWEDLCMLIVAMLYTIEINLLVKSSITPTNLIPPGEIDPTDEAQIQLEIYGSKLIVALEMVYCATIWGCKACLLLFYANMTIALPQNTWTKIVSAYAVIGYVVMVILYLGVWCQPFYNYWSVPAANPQCATAEHHLIVNLVFNTSSDLMMMLIPLPMLIKTNLPLKKKLILCGVFSLGLFCILSAVLNKYYSFTSPWGSEWVYWYDREVSTAVIVANVPHLWVLVRKAFRLPSFISNQTESKHSRVNPPRFFDNVADPLGSNVPRRNVRDTPSTTLEGVDIDQFMALDDIEAARTPSRSSSRRSTLLPESDRDVKSTKASQASSYESDRTVLDVQYLQLPPSPLTPRTTSSDTRLLSSNPSSPKFGR